MAEANAIASAFLRAGFLEEPDQTTSRELLREYTEARLSAAENPELLEEVITRSEEIQGQLWLIVEENVQGGKESATVALLAEAVNEVINVHIQRITAGERRLPRMYGILLMTATLLSFLLIGVASSADNRRASAAVVLYALAFMAVLLIVIDLDRPQEGFVTVSQQALTDVLRRMTAAGY